MSPWKLPVLHTAEYPIVPWAPRLPSSYKSSLDGFRQMPGRTSGRLNRACTASIQLSARFVACELVAGREWGLKGFHERTVSIVRSVAVTFHRCHFRTWWSTGRIVCGGTGRWSHGDGQEDTGRRLRPGRLGSYPHASAWISALSSGALRIRFE